MWGASKSAHSSRQTVSFFELRLLLLLQSWDECGSKGNEKAPQEIESTEWPSSFLLLLQHVIPLTEVSALEKRSSLFVSAIELFTRSQKVMRSDKRFVVFSYLFFSITFRDFRIGVRSLQRLRKPLPRSSKTASQAHSSALSLIGYETCVFRGSVLTSH